VKLWRRIVCLWRSCHNPVRHPLGGFRCAECGLAAASMDGLGFAGYVPALRRVCERDGGLIRTSEWSPTRRGW
jgi:hypothetical protein